MTIFNILSSFQFEISYVAILPLPFNFSIVDFPSDVQYTAIVSFNSFPTLSRRKYADVPMHA